MMLAAALLLSLLAPADAVAADCPGGRTVTRAELRAAGAGRVGDALRLVAPLTAWTVDGFDAEPRDGRGALQILLDGVPWQTGTTVEPGALDALPVTVSEVEAVVYCPGPRLVNGRIVGATLDVRTAPPPRLAARVDFGNETGDPGPARYLDPALPNQDHWGPDAEVVGRAGPVWASLRARSFLPTDTAIVARTAAAAGRFPEVDRTTAALAVRTARASGRLALATGDELPFLPYARREVAVARRAASGAAALRRGRLGLLLAGRHERLRAPERDGIAAELRARPWTETALDALFSSDFGDIRTGVGAELTALRGPSQRILGIDAFDSTTVDFSRTRIAARAWLAADIGRATVELSGTAGKQTAGGAVVRLPLIRGGPVLTLAARSTPELRVPPRFSFGPLAVSEDPFGGLWGLQSTSLDARLDSRRTVGPFAVQWGLSAWSGTDARAVVYAGHRDSPNWLAFSNTRERGLRAQTAATWQRGPLRTGADVAVQTEHVDVQRTRSGVVATEGRAPAASAGFTVAWSPARTLSLSARAEATTAYDAIGGSIEAPGAGRLPGGVVLDLAARRSVWGDRLALSLVGHNVLGAPEQPSAVGARLGPRLFGRLSVRL